MVGDPLVVELRIQFKNERHFSANSKLSGYQHLDNDTHAAAFASTQDVDLMQERSGGKFSVIMVSYDFVGAAVYAGDPSKPSFVLPSIEQMEYQTTNAFVSVDGKHALLKALQASDDPILRRIMDVDAYNVPVQSHSQHDSETTDDNGDTNGIKEGVNTEEVKKNKGDLDLLFVILITSGFVCTTFLIFFLIHRKVKIYHFNEGKKISKKYNKRNKNYTPVESPDSSFFTEGESPVGIVGGSNSHDTCPSSQQGEEEYKHRMSEYSCFPIIENDISMEDEAIYNITFSHHVVKQDIMTSSDGVSLCNSSVCDNQSQIENETLDELYSEQDSYFDASVISHTLDNTPNAHRGLHRREDSLESMENTLNRTCDRNSGLVTHIEGIHDVVDSKDLYKSLGLSLGSALSPPRNDKPEASNDIQTIEEQSNIDKNTDDARSQHSDKSDTDDLFARVMELENKMNLSESVWSEVSPTPKEKSSSRPKKIENMFKNVYHPTTGSKSNRDIAAGIFTHETLGAINRNRLKATPPPSEGEYDQELVDTSTESKLLGWMPDSDSDEDSILNR